MSGGRSPDDALLAAEAAGRAFLAALENLRQQNGSRALSIATTHAETAMLWLKEHKA